MNQNKFMLYCFFKIFCFFKHFCMDIFSMLLVELVLITKLLRYPPLALTIAAKTSLKALGDNLWRSKVATTSSKLTIFLGTLSSTKSSAGWYLEESSWSSKLEELVLDNDKELWLLALEKYCEELSTTLLKGGEKLKKYLKHFFTEFQPSTIYRFWDISIQSGEISPTALPFKI